MDNKDRIYRVTLTLSTAVTAPDEWTALDTVANSLPDQFQFGEFGNILPFEYEGMDFEVIDEENLPRP